MNVIKDKLKEVLSSVLPITIIVLVLNFTITPLDTPQLIRFLIGAFVLIVGLTIFLIGVDVGITPVGSIMGTAIAKSNKVWIVVVSGIFLGFIVSVAEPDLHILAEQIASVTSGQVSSMFVLVVVSLGIAIFLAFGLMKIVYNIPLHKILTVIYGLIFLLATLTSPEFLAISFDASGATTGALTVPFILALSVGISKIKKDSKASEKDSFGLVAIASTGAIISVMLTSIIANFSDISGSADVSTEPGSAILKPFIELLPSTMSEIFIAILPIVVIFLIFQKTTFKLSRFVLTKIMSGIMFTFVGLVLFLLGVNAGFMEVGVTIGYKLASMNSHIYLVVVAFILGTVTILAEPAVHVLTQQVEDVTSGYVPRNMVMVTLSIGVALAVSLSIIRIMVPQLQLWHYLLPGYLLAIILTYISPKLFVGIAFDSGGVASGPMAATFILAFAQGTASAIEGANVLMDGFGVIAMIAMTPLIALQILGIVFKIKSKGES